MTRTELSLRPFELADAAMVVPWLDAPGIGLPPGTAREQWAERLLVDPRVSAWIAEARRVPGPAAAAVEPVGFVRLDVGPDRIAELTVAVSQDWRRRGVGSRMLGLVRQACQQRRLRRLYAVVDPGNRPALAFFRENGFEDQGDCAGAVRFVCWIHETDPEALEIEG